MNEYTESPEELDDNWAEFFSDGTPVMSKVSLVKNQYTWPPRELREDHAQTSLYRKLWSREWNALLNAGMCDRDDFEMMDKVSNDTHMLMDLLGNNSRNTLRLVFAAFKGE